MTYLTRPIDVDIGTKGISVSFPGVKIETVLGLSTWADNYAVSVNPQSCWDGNIFTDPKGSWNGDTFIMS